MKSITKLPFTPDQINKKGDEQLPSLQYNQQKSAKALNFITRNDKMQQSYSQNILQTNTQKISNDPYLSKEMYGFVNNINSINKNLDQINKKQQLLAMTKLNNGNINGSQDFSSPNNNNINGAANKNYFQGITPHTTSGQPKSYSLSAKKNTKFDYNLPPLQDNTLLKQSMQLNPGSTTNNNENTSIANQTTIQKQIDTTINGTIQNSNRNQVHSRKALTKIIQQTYQNPPSQSVNLQKSTQPPVKYSFNGQIKATPDHKNSVSHITSNHQTPKSISTVNQNYYVKGNNNEEDLLDINQLPKIEASRCASKSLGLITSYGANTHQGLVRNYNEDRVSIILNMMKPANKTDQKPWPNCSFFAIYDGHGGAACAEFLRDNLHYYIIKDDAFPENPKLAIQKGFEKAEKAYLEKAEKQRVLDRSGSCAIVALIVDSTCYVANVGDSRAVLSVDNGKKVVDLSIDHKPSNPDEEKRILAHGGKLYQSSLPATFLQKNNQRSQEIIKGPMRVMPGRLAVSRTMGDAEAKIPKYGGIPNVISAEPEIMVFQIQDDNDFILLGCDGMFDKLTNQQIIDFVWQNNAQYTNIHDFVGRSIEFIIRQTLIYKSLDNLTVVIIGLKNLERLFMSRKQSQHVSLPSSNSNNTNVNNNYYSTNQNQQKN